MSKALHSRRWICVWCEGFLWAVGAAAVARFQPAWAADGDIDTTFGTGGYELINWKTPGDAIPNSIAIDSAGRILIAGQAQNYNPSGQPTDSDFLLTRLLSNGPVDTTFAADGNGFRVVDFGLAGIGASSTAQAYDLAIQPDGRIVAAGCAYYDSVHSHFAVIRVDAAGNLDATFADNGTAHFGYSFADINCANAATIDALGNIVLAGDIAYNQASGFHYLGSVARLTPTGQLDAAFNGGGIEQFLYWEQPPQQAQFNLSYAIGIDGSGRILAAGEADTPNPMSGAVVRMTSTGMLDASFGTQSRALIPVAGSTANAIYVEPSGASVVAGYGTVGSQSAVFIAKYAADGTPDAAFGTNGVTTILANGVGTATLVAPTHAGGWLAAGPYSRQGVFLAKVLANGQPDPSFGTGGYLAVPFQPSGNIFDAYKPALQSDGKLVVAGHLPAAAASGTADFGVMRILADYDTIFGNGFEAVP